VESRLPGIFISYRRSDTPDAVERIYDRLVAEFGKARVYMRRLTNRCSVPG
jgi:hypothetical protein